MNIRQGIRFLLRFVLVRPPKDKILAKFRYAPRPSIAHRARAKQRLRQAAVSAGHRSVELEEAPA